MRQISLKFRTKLFYALNAFTEYFELNSIIMLLIDVISIIAYFFKKYLERK